MIAGSMYTNSQCLQGQRLWYDGVGILAIYSTLRSLSVGFCVSYKVKPVLRWITLAENDVGKLHFSIENRTPIRRRCEH